MTKRVVNVSKQSIELGGNRVNQLSVGPFRDVGKTRQRIVSSEVYNPAWVVKTSTCSSGSVVSSYWLIVNPFQRAGSSASMIPSTKGWRLAALGLASVWLVVVCARDSSRLVPSPPFSLLRDSSLWGDSAQFALASASSPLLGRSILPRSCALILPTGSSSLLASLLLLNFD